MTSRNIYYLVNPKYGEGYQGEYQPTSFKRDMKAIGKNVKLHFQKGEDGINWYVDGYGDPVLVMPGHPSASNDQRLDAYSIQIVHNSQDKTGAVIFHDTDEINSWGWYTYSMREGILTESDDNIGYKSFLETKDVAIKALIECDLKPEDIDTWHFGEPNERIMELLEGLKKAGYIMKLWGGGTKWMEQLSINLGT